MQIADLKINPGAGCVKIGPDKIVVDKILRAVQQVDIAEDPAHPEAVLVFHVAAVAPFKDQYSQAVRSLAQMVRDVELMRRVGDLAVADVLTVEPEIKTGIHSLKVKIGSRSLFEPLILKIEQIGAAGIIGRNIRRISGKRIAVVGVLMAVAPVILPDRRNGDLPESIGIEVCSVEFFLQLIDAVIIAEPPDTVQTLKPV